ncbi:MAG: hypothetical protein J5449_01835 [Oscillospiraceae bacterium]|nr:hypothetical protein [Oscillospiraceae bacterium]
MAETKQKGYARRVAVMLAGIAVMGVGVALFKLSLMGNDPSTAMVIAIGERVGVDFSLILIGMNCLWFLVEWRFAREMTGVGTFVNWFCVGPLASLTEKAVLARGPLPEALLPRLALMLAGVLVLSFACALYQTADVGIAPYDALSLVLSKKSGRKYFWCRMLTDSVCVAVAFLLGGIVGAGTLVCALGLGPFIQFFSRHAAQPLIYGKSAEEPR